MQPLPQCQVTWIGGPLRILDQHFPPAPENRGLSPKKYGDGGASFDPIESHRVETPGFFTLSQRPVPYSTQPWVILSTKACFREGEDLNACLAVTVNSRRINAAHPVCPCHWQSCTPSSITQAREPPPPTSYTCRHIPGYRWDGIASNRHTYRPKMPRLELSAR